MAYDRQATESSAGAEISEPIPLRLPPGSRQLGMMSGEERLTRGNKG